MPKAVVDPGELRRFAHSLKRFSNEMHNQVMSLQGQFSGLADTWRDQEHEKFAQEFSQTMQVINRFLEAADQFSAATRLKPAAADAWNELSAALVLGEQYPQALAAFDHIRALGAENPGNLFFRALSHDRLRQRPEAVENYNKFLAISQGKFPDQEFQARQRVRILQAELRKQ